MQRWPFFQRVLVCDEQESESECMERGCCQDTSEMAYCTRMAQSGDTQYVCPATKTVRSEHDWHQPAVRVQLWLCLIMCAHAYVR